MDVTLEVAIDAATRVWLGDRNTVPEAASRGEGSESRLQGQLDVLQAIAPQIDAQRLREMIVARKNAIDSANATLVLRESGDATVSDLRGRKDWDIEKILRS